MEPSGPSAPAPNDPSKPGGDAAAASPAKPASKFWGRFFLRLVVYGTPILLLAAIAIPNFVKARTTTCKNACVANLKQIDGAIQQWALENRKAGSDAVVLEAVVTYLKGGLLPSCPAGGKYSVSIVSEDPTCYTGDEGSGSHSLEGLKPVRR
jgi:hypothetical protein